jgi:hypothetical protein
MNKWMDATDAMELLMDREGLSWGHLGWTSRMAVLRGESVASISHLIFSRLSFVVGVRMAFKYIVLVPVLVSQTNNSISSCDTAVSFYLFRYGYPLLSVICELRDVRGVGFSVSNRAIRPGQAPWSGSNAV